MYFHRRQIRQEKIGLSLEIPMKEFLYGPRRVLSGETPLDIHSKSLPNLPELNPKMETSLFLNWNGKPIREEGIISRLRTFAEKVGGKTVSKMTLRSLRQVFQFHFYKSNPNFTELRAFNLAMDHSDTTGLLYYNKSQVTKISIPGESIEFLKNFSSSNENYNERRENPNLALNLRRNPDHYRSNNFHFSPGEIPSPRNVSPVVPRMRHSVGPSPPSSSPLPSIWARKPSVFRP